MEADCTRKPTVNNPYDEFAWFYDRYWAQPFLQFSLPAVERLLLEGLEPGSRILDVCCGTGHLARILTDRGFAVTGIDGSAGMLQKAAENAPNALFLRSNAACFELAEPAHAALCAFDSVNHILAADELVAAFRNIRAALLPGGRFLCDVNTPDAYGEEWDKTWCAIEPAHACILRGHFDAQTQTGTTQVTMFRLDTEWRRSDIEVVQRSYRPDEIEQMLTSAGFSGVQVFDATEDLRLEGHFGKGRVYIRACAV